MQAADEDALADEVGLLRRRAFVVVLEAAAQARHGSAVDDVEVLLAKLAAEHHDLLHAVVFVDEVGFGEVTERLVAEDAGEDRVEDDGVDARLDVGCVQKLDGAVGDHVRRLIKRIDVREVVEGAKAHARLLHVAVAARGRRQPRDDVDALLLDVGALGAGERDALVGIAVDDVRAGNAVDREHPRVVAVEDLLLARERDRARVHRYIKWNDIDDRIDRRQDARLLADVASLRHCFFDPRADIVGLVEADEAPAAVDERPCAAAEAPRTADLLQLLAPVNEARSGGIVDPNLEVVGVVAANGRFDVISGSQLVRH